MQQETSKERHAKKKKKGRTWAEAAKIVLEMNSRIPMGHKEILRGIKNHDLKDTSGSAPLACLNSMLHLHSRKANPLFYKVAGRMGVYGLKSQIPDGATLLEMEEEFGIDSDAGGDGEPTEPLGSKSTSKKKEKVLYVKLPQGYSTIPPDPGSPSNNCAVSESVITSSQEPSLIIKERPKPINPNVVPPITLSIPKAYQNCPSMILSSSAISSSPAKVSQTHSKRAIKHALKQQQKRRRKNTSFAAGGTSTGLVPRIIMKPLLPPPTAAESRVTATISTVVAAGPSHSKKTLYFSSSSSSSSSTTSSSSSSSRVSCKIAQSRKRTTGSTSAPGRTLSQRESTKAVAASTFSMKTRKRSLRKVNSGSASDDSQYHPRGGFCVDLKTPHSILANTHLRELLNKQALASLPPGCQQKLIQLMPEVDRVPGTDNALRLCSTALNNEFFARACAQWRNRLSEGEFTPENQIRRKAEGERDQGKVDPWKIKHFEPIWGQKHVHHDRTPSPEASCSSARPPCYLSTSLTTRSSTLALANRGLSSASMAASASPAASPSRTSRRVPRVVVSMLKTGAGGVVVYPSVVDAAAASGSTVTPPPISSVALEEPPSPVVLVDPPAVEPKQELEPVVEPEASASSADILLGKRSLANDTCDDDPTVDVLTCKKLRPGSSSSLEDDLVASTPPPMKSEVIVEAVISPVTIETISEIPLELPTSQILDDELDAHPLFDAVDQSPGKENQLCPSEQEQGDQSGVQEIVGMDVTDSNEVIDCAGAEPKPIVITPTTPMVVPHMRPALGSTGRGSHALAKRNAEGVNMERSYQICQEVLRSSQNARLRQKATGNSAGTAAVAPTLTPAPVPIQPWQQQQVPGLPLNVSSARAQSLSVMLPPTLGEMTGGSSWNPQSGASLAPFAVPSHLGCPRLPSLLPLGMPMIVSTTGGAATFTTAATSTVTSTMAGDNIYLASARLAPSTKMSADGKLPEFGTSLLMSGRSVSGVDSIPVLAFATTTDPATREVTRKLVIVNAPAPSLSGQNAKLTPVAIGREQSPPQRQQGFPVSLLRSATTSERPRLLASSSSSSCTSSSSTSSFVVTSLGAVPPSPSPPHPPIVATSRASPLGVVGVWGAGPGDRGMATAISRSSVVTHGAGDRVLETFPRPASCSSSASSISSLGSLDGIMTNNMNSCPVSVGANLQFVARPSQQLLASPLTSLHHHQQQHHHQVEPQQKLVPQYVLSLQNSTAIRQQQQHHQQYVLVSPAGTIGKLPARASSAPPLQAASHLRFAPSAGGGLPNRSSSATDELAKMMAESTNDGYGGPGPNSYETKRDAATPVGRQYLVTPHVGPTADQHPNPVMAVLPMIGPRLLQLDGLNCGAIRLNATNVGRNMVNPVGGGSGGGGSFLGNLTAASNYPAVATLAATSVTPTTMLVGGGTLLPTNVAGTFYVPQRVTRLPVVSVGGGMVTAQHHQHQLLAPSPPRTSATLAIQQQQQQHHHSHQMAHMVRSGLGLMPVANQATPGMLGGMQSSTNCVCNLRAMMACSKCGAFCHDDCISGPLRLCVTCLIR